MIAPTMLHRLGSRGGIIGKFFRHRLRLHILVIFFIVPSSFTSCDTRPGETDASLASYNKIHDDLSGWMLRETENSGTNELVSVINIIELEAILNSHGYSEIYINDSAVTSDGVDLAYPCVLAIRFPDGRIRRFLFPPEGTRGLRKIKSDDYMLLERAIESRTKPSRSNTPGEKNRLRVARQLDVV